ncbi:unnamed protein product [Paramecium sonneborni]|uniref:Uncharacterized protein n=1 Tax=Paramecium sonneborni TaxID=65129 RepID=A0A8S1MH99_9CILI|nr:unnamed protein product [Paramecium sonneborni]
MKFCLRQIVQQNVLPLVRLPKIILVQWHLKIKINNKELIKDIRILYNQYQMLTWQMNRFKKMLEKPILRNF